MLPCFALNSVGDTWQIVVVDGDSLYELSEAAEVCVNEQFVGTLRVLRSSVFEAVLSVGFAELLSGRLAKPGNLGVDIPRPNRIGHITVFLKERRVLAARATTLTSR